MIAKHSHEQSQKGEGVEVIENRPHEDPVHGKGQFTEKRIYIGSKLPYYIKKMVPKTFYVTEKAWNYYPFTITEYSVRQKQTWQQNDHELCFSVPSCPVSRSTS